MRTFEHPMLFFKAYKMRYLNRTYRTKLSKCIMLINKSNPFFKCLFLSYINIGYFIETVMFIIIYHKVMKNKMQQYYDHRAPGKASYDKIRINLTFRYITNHEHECCKKMPMNKHMTNGRAMSNKFLFNVITYANDRAMCKKKI